MVCLRIRVENSQLGVFLAYAGRSGRALIDRELYLPESWIGDPDRCADAGIPENCCSAGVLTRPRLAEAMIARTMDAGVVAGWVTADSAYGRDGKFRAFCEARRLSYVLEVPVKQTVTDLDGRRRVDTLVGRAPAKPYFGPWTHPFWMGPGAIAGPPLVADLSALVEFRS
ncbi:transposase [Nocardia aurea]|uniref:transposase n=1 Tax=Nocardia aurea TaxID=2144174 RepID=UPI003F4D67B6